MSDNEKRASNISLDKIPSHHSRIELPIRKCSISCDFMGFWAFSVSVTKLLSPRMKLK